MNNSIDNNSVVFGSDLRLLLNEAYRQKIFFLSSKQLSYFIEHFKDAFFNVKDISLLDLKLVPSDIKDIFQDIAKKLDRKVRSLEGQYAPYDPEMFPITRVVLKDWFKEEDIIYSKLNNDNTPVKLKKYALIKYPPDVIKYIQEGRCFYPMGIGNQKKSYKPTIEDTMYFNDVVTIKKESTGAILYLGVW